MDDGASSYSTGGQYGDVRVAFDIDALNLFIADRAPAIAVPVAVKQFGSNPTYCLIDQRQTRFVLRKKPAGKLLTPTAHAVEREFRVLSALYAYNNRPSTPPSRCIPVPRPIVLCDDHLVIGTPFYIMEFLQGRIFTDPKILELTASERRACWVSAVQILGRLAVLDPDEMGLSSFGSRELFFPRQLRSIGKLSRAQASTVIIDKTSTANRSVGDLPFFDESLSWFEKNLPDERMTGVRIVHGDYKIDNLVFHPSEPRVIGILDWELSTLGNPLSDLGNLVLPFNFGPAFASKGYLSNGFVGAPAYKAPISLEEIELEYRKVTQQGPLGPDFIAVRSWMMFRFAVGIQGIAARVARGQASSANASEFAESFSVWATIAKSIRDGTAEVAKL